MQFTGDFKTKDLYGKSLKVSGSISKDKASMIQQVKNVKSVEGEYLF